MRCLTNIALTNAWYTIIYYHRVHMFCSKRTSHQLASLASPPIQCCSEKSFLAKQINNAIYLQRFFFLRTKETKIIQFSLKMLLLERSKNFRLPVYLRLSRQ